MSKIKKSNQSITLDVNLNGLNQIKKEVDEIIGKLKEANSLADELARKFKS